MSISSHAASTTLYTLFSVNQRVIEESRSIPLSVFNTFVGIVLWGHEEGSNKQPLSLEELADKLCQPYTTTYQALRYLGRGMRFGRPGLGWVDTPTMPSNRRQKFAMLTPKGRELADQLAALISQSQRP